MGDVFSNELSLKDAVSFIVDNRGKSAPTESNGVKLIATNCISNERLYPSYEQLRFVSEETYHHWFRSHPEPGDIILTNKGSKNGAICLVPDPVDFCIAQDMVALRADKSIIHPLYLFAALRSDLLQSRIKNLNVDAVIPHLKKTDFNKLYIPLPSRKAQEFIGNLYFDICNKIELNRQMNETLEAMARALFRDWFVDFGPTHTKQEGRAPYLAPELWALFPDRLDDEGKPEGWERGVLGDIVKLAYGKALKKTDRVQGNIPVYGSGGITGYHNKALVNGPSIIVGRKGTVGSLYWEDGSFYPIDTVFYTQTDIPLTFCYYQMQVLGLENLNTDAAVPGLNRNNAYIQKITLPCNTIMGEFNNIIHSYRDKIQYNKAQNLTLANTRDLLLPKLMSGEIQLEDTEQCVEAVA